MATPEKILTDGQRWAVIFLIAVVVLTICGWITLGIWNSNAAYRVQLDACVAEGGSLVQVQGSSVPMCVQVLREVK